MDSRHNRENWHQPMQIQLSEKRNFFFQFFPAFLKSTWNSEHFENKDGPHSFQISEINDSERCGYIISKRPCFRTLFDRQRLKVSQTLLKLAREQFFHIFSLLWEKLGSKKSLLVTSKILGLFVHALTPDDKYYLGIRENLPQPIQKQWSKELKIFLQFFNTFLKSTFNFERFKKKVSVIAYVFPKLKTTKDEVT